VSSSTGSLGLRNSTLLSWCVNINCGLAFSVAGVLRSRAIHIQDNIGGLSVLNAWYWSMLYLRSVRLWRNLHSGKYIRCPGWSRCLLAMDLLAVT